VQIHLESFGKQRNYHAQSASESTRTGENMGLMPIDHFVAPQISAHVKPKTVCQPAIPIDSISLGWDYTIASIIRIPPNKPPVAGDVSFKDLPCSLEDAKKINRLITVMGENGKLALLMKYQKELRQIGRDIDHVHPLKLVEIIMTQTDPNGTPLKKHLKSIHSDYFKWSNFLDGVGNALSAQFKQGRVSIYLNDFAKAVGVAPESIQNYFQAQEWENLLIYLMHN
jgi:hypothetical protein